MAWALCAALAVVAAYLGKRWFDYYVFSCTLLWYLQEKEVPFPSEEEKKRGAQWVGKHITQDVFGNKR